MSGYAGLRVLVTGGTGFLGGALARRLLADGAHVTVLARNAQKAAPLAELGATIVHGDLTDGTAVYEAARGAHVVFHVAALLGGPYAAQHAVNEGGTRLLLEAVEPDLRRFVHVSSIAVYGNVLPLRVTEDTLLAPGASPYGQSKAEAEAAVWAVAAERGLPVTIIRPGMIYGPGSNMWTANVFQLARLRPTPFFGSGQMPAPVIWLDDLLDLLVCAGEHPSAVGNAFNAVMDPAPSWRSYIGAHSALAGHHDWLPIPVIVGRIFAGMTMLLAPRDSVPRDLPDMLERVIGPSSFSAEKAAALLGWRACTPVVEGVRQSAGWLRQQELLTPPDRR